MLAWIVLIILISGCLNYPLTRVRRPNNGQGASGYAQKQQRERTKQEKGEGVGGLVALIGALLPNTFYSRPKYRFPYYDRTGKGYLLYGYGEDKLYEYTVFKPLEGYF